MKPSSIIALRPNVTQVEAVREFSKGGLSSLYWQAKAGTLRRIADCYVPYQLYEVSCEMTGAPHTRIFAMDAMDGSLDLFEFPRIPDPEQLLDVETRNHMEPALSVTAAEALLREKALRVIVQQGFFKVREATLKFSRQPAVVYLPYWLGFYAHRETVRCRVLDAVRRRIEGAKASAFFEQWLAT